MTYGPVGYLARRASKLPDLGLKKCAVAPTKSEQTEYCNTVAVPFNEGTRNLYLSEVYDSRHTSGRLRDRKIFTENENFRSLLKRFYIALDAYSDSPNPVIPLAEIISGCSTGPSYVKKLKTIKLLSYIKSQGLKLLEYPKEYESIPSYLISDIGDIFNYRYLFHWEEEVDDYLDGLIEMPLISSASLKELEDKVFSILPDSVKRIAPEEILLSVSSSSSTSEKDFRPSRQWKERGMNSGMQFSNSALIGRRTVVQVGPGNSRDTVVLPLSQVNSIRYIDAQVWEVLSQMPLHAMFKDPDYQKQIIDEFESDLYFFYCRDLRKEGIVKPRVIVETLLKALVRKYPHLEAFQYGGIYSGYTLLEDGKIMPMLRGHGLGMANALTTLMNISMFYLTIDEIWKHEPVCGRISSLSYNDDFVAGFELESDLEAYYSYEDDVLTRFGLIRKPEKSFMGHKSFVFLETYYPEPINRKNSYYRREILNSLSCTNIVHAKELINSLTERVQPSLVREYLPEIVSTFGYEFFPGEERLPYTLGGWIGYRFRSVSLDLNIYFDQEEHYDARVYRAFKACMTQVVLTKRGLKNQFRSPLEYLFPLSLDVTDERFRRKFYLGCTYSDMSTTFESISSSPSLSLIYWRKRYKRRALEFRSYPNIYDPLQAYNLIVKDINYDFLGSSRMPHDRVSIIESSITRPRDVYRFTSNPFLGLISAYTGLKFPDVYPNKYAGMLAQQARFTRLSEHVSTAKIAENCAVRVGGEGYLYDKSFLPILPLVVEGDELSFLESFNDPTDAWMAARSVGLHFVPFHSEKKTEFLSEKKEVYGRLLTLNEIEVILSNKIEDPDIIKELVIEDYVLSYHLFRDEDLSVSDWDTSDPEIEPEPPDEESGCFGPDEVPDIWNSSYVGHPIYYEAWDELRRAITHWELRGALSGLSESVKGNLFPLSWNAVSLCRILKQNLVYEKGTVYLDFEPKDMFGSDSDSEGGIGSFF